MHGRRLNVGSAFKKTPTYGRTFGPTTFPAMAFDPYHMSMYPWQYMASNMKPGGMPQVPPPFYMAPAYPGGYPQYNLYAPGPNTMQRSPYPTQMAVSASAPASPGPQYNGTSMAQALHLANVLYQSGGNMSPQPQLQTDLDCSYMTSSSNSSSSRNGGSGSDRSANDRFQYAVAPAFSSGHCDQRSPRLHNIPQPIRVPEMSPGPYQGNGISSSIYPSSNMRHQYVGH